MQKIRKQLFFIMVFVLPWSTCLILTPVTAADPIVDETVTVPAGAYRYYFFNINYDNVKLTIAIEVLSGNDITVHVTDETNYEKWIEGESAQGYLSRQKMGSFTADLTLGPAGRYYVILDNTYSVITGKSVHIVIEAEERTNLSLVILGILAVMGGGGILAVILIIRRRSTPRVFPPHPMVPTTSSPTVPPMKQSFYGFCPSCGNPIDHSGKFCMKCGQRIPSKE